MKLEKINLIQLKVFCYVSFGTEVHTHELILELLALGKRVCVPKTYDNGIMDAVEITSLSGLSENRFGTLEPIFGKIVEKDFIDIVIIPALCYDKVGYRLGYGKGYYDRYLDGYNGRKIGICPSLCVVSDALPSSHDIKADMIITENGIITF